MKKCFVLICFLYSFFLPAQQINLVKIKTHIKFLTSDKLKGRETGSQEELTAANYIAKSFKSCGLQPKGNISSYFYSFKFKKPKDKSDTIGGETISAIDVAGYLDNGAVYTIIIGAHYDHLRMGMDHNSLDPNPE